MYRSNPRGLWTDCKQAPVHSTGRGPAAENNESSEKETEIDDAIKWTLELLIHRVINCSGKGASKIPGEHQFDIFQSLIHTCM